MLDPPLKGIIMTVMKRLIELTGKNKTATLQCYRAGELHYEIDCGFKFTVPVTGTDGEGNLTFENTEYEANVPSSVFRRHVKKALELIEGNNERTQ